MVNIAVLHPLKTAPRIYLKTSANEGDERVTCTYQWKSESEV